MTSATRISTGKFAWHLFSLKLTVPRHGPVLLNLLVACRASRYTWAVIRSFRHKGLKRLYERDDLRGISGDLLLKVQIILAHLDAAATPDDMALPGFLLHPLKGRLRGFWSVSVSGNWRIVFRLENGEAFDVELVDYH